MKILDFFKNSVSRSTAISIVLAAFLAIVIFIASLAHPWAGIVLSLLCLCGLPFWVRFWMQASFKVERQILTLAKTSRRMQNKAAYYESILQDSTDMIFTIDPDGYILKFNKGAEENFGYTQVEIVGKSFKQFFVNEADEKETYDTVLRDGKISNREVAMKTRAGEIIFASLSLSEMKNEDGKIIGLVATCKNITEKRKLEQELIEKNRLLEEMAITDNLTGLYNSRHFYENLHRELLRLKRQGNVRLALLMIDVDRFKVYNDTYGHQEGDKVLRNLGRIIATTIRKDIDMGYRYGGDEFTVILPNTDKVQAQRVADRIGAFYDQEGFKPTSLSIGIADTDGSHSKEDLVKIADEEMYRRKKHHR